MKTWLEGNKLTIFSLTCGAITLIGSQWLPITPRVILTAFGSLTLGIAIMLGTLCWLQDEALEQSAHDMQVMHEANKQLLITLIDHVAGEDHEQRTR
jgi:hypothetical protein